jgi:hypothetical protein
MNRDDEFIARLEDYLETFDGVTPLPERVRDAVNVRVPAIRQVRPDRGTGRIVNMLSHASVPARLAGVAAALVAAVALGAWAISTTQDSPGVGAVATASPTASPTPVPTPSGPQTLVDAPLVACYPGGDPTGCMAPGTYRLSTPSWPGIITMDVPAGWFSWSPGPDEEGVLVDGGPDAPMGSGWGAMFMTVGSVSRDPCNTDKGVFDPDQTATVDGLVAAMRSWPGFTVSEPTPVSLGGYDGQLVDVTSSLTLPACPAAVLWTTPKGSEIDGYSIVVEWDTPHTVQFRIVDVGGRLLVLRTTDYPETSPDEMRQAVPLDPVRHVADQVELHQIVDSVRIEPSTP